MTGIINGLITVFYKQNYTLQIPLALRFVFMPIFSTVLLPILKSILHNVYRVFLDTSLKIFKLISCLIITHRANLCEIFIVKIFHKNENDLESQFNV